MRTSRWWTGALWLASCASTEAKLGPPAPLAPLPPLPRSSIAAVLEHQGELGLSGDQVQQLQAIDQKREQGDASLRAELEALSHPAASSSSGSTSGGGMGPGMGGMGGMGGRRGGGRMGGAPRSQGPSVASRQDAIQKKLDDDDTQAFLQAEPLFAAGQKEKAEDIAEHYREQLFDRQQHPAAP